jgi:ABC-type Fe3+-citrate transport system substrate-binding protein
MMCITSFVVLLLLTLNGCSVFPSVRAEPDDPKKYKTHLTAVKSSQLTLVNSVRANGFNISELSKYFSVLFTALGYSTTYICRFKTEASVKRGASNLNILNSELIIESPAEVLLWHKKHRTRRNFNSIISERTFTF